MPIEVVKDTYNIKEGSTVVGVSPNTFKKLLNSGKVRFIRVGRRVLIPHKAIEEFLNPNIQ